MNNLENKFWNNVHNKTQFYFLTKLALSSTLHQDEFALNKHLVTLPECHTLVLLNSKCKQGRKTWWIFCGRDWKSNRMTLHWDVKLFSLQTSSIIMMTTTMKQRFPWTHSSMRRLVVVWSKKRTLTHSELVIVTKCAITTKSKQPNF